jgi:hypothetical protein
MKEEVGLGKPREQKRKRKESGPASGGTSCSPLCGRFSMAGQGSGSREMTLVQE